MQSHHANGGFTTGNLDNKDAGNNSEDDLRSES